MKKTCEVRISISTNPAVAHIGRYFIDVRDTTGGVNRQMTTRVTNKPVDLALGLIAAGERAGVEVTVVDETGEWPQANATSERSN